MDRYTKRLTIRMTETQYARMKECAERIGVSMNSFCRVSVVEELQKQCNGYGTANKTFRTELNRVG